MNPYVLLLIASNIIASSSQILLKKSAGKKYSSFIREYLNIFVIAGYGMMMLSLYMTMCSYAGLDYTNVPLLESMGYIFVMILSRIFFKEKITKNKVIGMLFILGGILVYHI